MSFTFRKRIMDRVKEWAYGKINLSLDVLSRRENGYHDVSMVMQTVDMYDIISLNKTDNDNEIKLTSNVKTLPLDATNIVCKAVKLVKEEYGLTTGVEIHIEKHLPIAAGMGGGSADAAAALRGMNRLFGLGLSYENLEELGVSADKITSIGYGELKPIASNKTKEGRAENRRVEARFNK